MWKFSVLVILLIYSFNNFAFKFSPMVISIPPTPPNNKTKVTVENDSFEKMAIEISITKRIMDSYGVEEHPIEKKDFQIYPEQLILAPKEKRVIQIKWLGTNQQDTELAYRLIAEQLPINLDKKNNNKSSLKIQMRYLGALYITPENTNPIITLEKINKTKDNGKIELLVNNSGTKHAVLKNLKLIYDVVAFGNINKTYEQKNDQLKGMNGENILAKSKRYFTITLPEELQNKIYKKLNIKMYFDQE